MDNKTMEILRQAVQSMEWAAMVIKDIPPGSHYMETLREAKELLAEMEEA